MRGMKVTVDAAMRARDVSRPHADDEAAARENDAAAVQARGGPGPAVPAPGRTPPEAAARPEAEGNQAARRPHRRRRRR